MKTVYEILKQVAATSSRNEKKAILEANKDNPLLKQVIFLAYDPFTLFWIKKIPSAQSLPDNHNDSMLLPEALSHLSVFSSAKRLVMQELNIWHGFLLMLIVKMHL